MNRLLTALSAAILVTLAAPAAWGCPVPEPGRGASVLPGPDSAAELPLSAFVHLSDDSNNPFVASSSGDAWPLLEFLGPDGSPVEWDITISGFSDRVWQARPVGGWLVGEYRGSGDSGTSPSAGSYTIVDVFDEQPPTLEILGWTGHSEPPSVAPCTGARGAVEGVELELDRRGEDVVVLHELLDEDGELIDAGVSFMSERSWGGNTLPAPAGSSLEVRLEAIDLSGNRATAEMSDLIACRGCSGSLGEGRASSLGSLGLILLGALLRRRNSN